MAYAYRQARRYGGRIWWVVLAFAALVRAVDRRGRRDSSSSYKVRPGQSLDVSVSPRESL